MFYSPAGDQDLLTASYGYDLPSHLIAERPDQSRDGCRLMVYHSRQDRVEHLTFNEIDRVLAPKTLFVRNNSKVFPCRLQGKRPTGGQVEIMVLGLVPDEGGYPCLVRSTGKKRLGDVYHLAGGESAKIESVGEGMFGLRFSCNDLLVYLERYAKIPIPPYIRGGQSDDQDREDYQTVYAQDVGSVAAPTAGLHFTQGLISGLEKTGHQFCDVTLHVGPGTFSPVRSDSIKEHSMHTESFQITADSADLVTQSDQVIAVGTTALRVLESCYREGRVRVPQGKGPWETSIFLHPGVKVHSINGLLTNFHLPESTLLMLVSALVGREKMHELYREAIAKEYRFYSYGDAMLIL